MNFESGKFDFPEKKNSFENKDSKPYSQYDDRQVKTFISFFLANEGGYKLKSNELIDNIKNRLKEAYNFPENEVALVSGTTLRIKLPSGEYFQKPLLNDQISDVA